MSNPNTFEALIERWRESSATDRKENAELNARLQRGEAVTITTIPYGPYVDARETYADELAALAPHYIHKDKVRELRKECRNAKNFGFGVQAMAAYEVIERKLTALLGEEA